MKILLIRLSAIGDVAMATPVIHAFRNAFQDAEIAWLVEESAQDVVRGNPDLNEVIVWPKVRWKRLWRERAYRELVSEIRFFTRKLRKRRFTMAIDMQGLLKSGVWAWLSGAPQRIGLGSKEGSAFLMTRLIARPAGMNRISSQYMHLVSELGMDVGDFTMQLPEHKEDTIFASDFVKDNNFCDIVTAAPFTTRPQKHWIESRWAEIAMELRRISGLPLIILGSPADSEAAERIVKKSKGAAVSAAGKTSLTQAIALIRRSSGFVGVDTGLTHCGVGLGIPTVALFGATCPYTNTASDSALVIYHSMECAPCRRKPVCGNSFRCMAAISTDEVVENLYLVMYKSGIPCRDTKLV